MPKKKTITGSNKGVGKKLTPLRVSLKKTKGKHKDIIKSNVWRSNYERKIYGAGQPLTQRVSFAAKRSHFSVELLNRDRKVVGRVGIFLGENKGGKYANIVHAKVEKELEKKGLFNQMLTEALFVLKKKGIKRVSVDAHQGHKTYEKLGFTTKEPNYGGERVGSVSYSKTL